MKVSLNWLREYVPHIKADTLSLTDKMVSAGLDIESVVNEGEIYERFVIGEVIEKKKHPNAEKLSLCGVNVGDKVLRIVCGAPNVEAGQKVCVALEKAIIPNGGYIIKKSKIRGELSEGMICSGSELNLSENHEGILVLDGEAKTGEGFADYIKANDIIFEIGITPNRGDLFSHIGIAREVAAIFDMKISLPEISFIESDTDTADLIKIRIESPEFCKRFTGRVIRNIKIKESPSWLQKRLKSVGLRPVNNVVDVTNFVMFETGQPLHAFDYDKIKGREIIVKNADQGDRFTSLDSKERILDSNSLMICDSNGYSGIAGIMGGEFSQITAETSNIFIECAYFDPVSIRKTSKFLGLQTDASQRFERGVDINMTEYASLRATQLIHELAGGEISKGLLDVYPEKFVNPHIELRPAKTSALIGVELPAEDIKKLLEKIEIKFIEEKDDALLFRIPEFRRVDIQREVDLIEEVARIYGYDNIEEDSNFNINSKNSHLYRNHHGKFTAEIVNHLIGRGFNQILTNTILNENTQIGKFDPRTDMSGSKSYKLVKLENSITSDFNSLRSDLLTGMLNVMKNNFNKSGKDISLKLFEIGRIFTNENNKFNEESRLIFAIAGKRDLELIHGGDKPFNIFDIKGEAEMFLSKLNLENYRLFYYNDNKISGFKIYAGLNDTLIGNIFMADKTLKDRFELETEVYVAEFNLNLLLENRKTGKFYRTISKFPPIKRDMALVVEKHVKYEEIRNLVLKTGGEYLKGINLFDLYEDEKLGINKRGIAFSLEFSSVEGTLKDDQINPIIDQIVKQLEINYGAKLRG